MTTKFGTGGSGGGGGGLLPTQAIIDDGQQITATNGQTISVAVADNVPSLTIKNWAFWEPFTVTVGEGGGQLGYSSIPGLEFGSITNEPVDGYTLDYCLIDSGGGFSMQISGPRGIGDSLWGADIGIDVQSYKFGPFNGIEAPYSEYDDDTSIAITVARILGRDIPVWAADQQIPIVIIPQNGG